MKYTILLVATAFIVLSCKKEKPLCTGGTATVYVDGVEQQIVSITSFFDKAIYYVDTSFNPTVPSAPLSKDGVTLQTIIKMSNNKSIGIDMQEVRDGQNRDVLRLVEYNSAGIYCINLTPRAPSEVCSRAQFDYSVLFDGGSSGRSAEESTENTVTFTAYNHSNFSATFDFSIREDTGIVHITGSLDNVCINRR